MAKEICPRCSGELKLQSGFRRCIKCQHTMGSQSLDIDWSITNDIGIKRASEADKAFKPYRGNNPRRRNPLNFEED